jgi:hypothetical protein
VSANASLSGASTAVDWKSMGHTVAQRSCKDADFLVFPVFSVAITEKRCDAGGNGEYNFRSGCLVSTDASVTGASFAVDWKSMGHTVAERSCKNVDFLFYSST